MVNPREHDDNFVEGPTGGQNQDGGSNLKQPPKRRRRSTDWGRPNGIKCFNETKPILKKGHWGLGSDRRLMNTVAETIDRMKMRVTVINVTQISEYRIDSHTSIYTKRGGQLLTDEQKNDPSHYADCYHWCLPGVPDTWNQILLAHL